MKIADWRNAIRYPYLCNSKKFVVANQKAEMRRYLSASVGTNSNESVIERFVFIPSCGGQVSPHLRL